MSLQIDIVRACYRKKVALENIHFSLCDGTLTAVIGRNGSGKSTLVSCLASLIPFEGNVTSAQQSLASLSHRDRARHVSCLLQEPAHPRMTVEELVACGRNPHRSLLEPLSQADLAAIEDALRAADLVSLRDRAADRLSGGELRRAYFGAILAQNAPNVLLDEATAFMDTDYEHRFLRMAQSLAHDRSRAVLCVLHDLSSALAYADRILLLNGGKQLFFGTVPALLSTTLIEQVFHVRRVTADSRVFFVPLEDEKGV